MSDMQPTPEGGASVTEQLEAFLAAGDTKQPEVKTGQEAAPEKHEPAGSQEDEPAGDEPGEDEGPQLNLSDVAKVLGVDESALDVDEDGTLKVKTKIDGKDGAAKFLDLVKSYQLQGHVDAKARQAAEQEKAIAERVKQVEQFATQGMQRLDMLAATAHQMLMAEYSGVNWDQLVREDPIAYTEKRHQFEARQAQLSGLMQQVEAQRQQFAEAYQWKQAQQFQAESARLQSLIPEWSDEKVGASERAELAKWLGEKGASPETINGLWDAGLVAALRAGMVAERNAPKVAAIEKKVRAAPKLARPGQSTTNAEKDEASLRGLKDQIRKSGGKSGIAEYLIATGRA